MGSVTRAVVALTHKTMSLPVSGEKATTAQNVAARRQGKSRRQNATGELANLSDKFSAIYGEVQTKVTEEHETQEDRLQSVEDHITRLQVAMLTEQQRRVHMLKTVETNLCTLYDDIQLKCKTQLEALKPDVPTRLAAWHTRLDSAFQMLEEEKVQRQIVIDRERRKLLKTVDDFEKQLEIEKVERLARETTMMQKVSTEVNQLQSVFEGERIRRETVLGHERDENDQIDAMRDRPDEVFKADMVSRMVAATKEIRMETARRLHSEQQFVAALESYTKSLQGGLRMVNKPPPRMDYSVTQR